MLRVESHLGRTTDRVEIRLALGFARNRHHRNCPSGFRRVNLPGDTLDTVGQPNILTVVMSHPVS